MRHNDRSNAVDDLLVLLLMLDIITSSEYRLVYTYDEYDAFIMRMR